MNYNIFSFHTYWFCFNVTKTFSYVWGNQFLRSYSYSKKNTSVCVTFTWHSLVKKMCNRNPVYVYFMMLNSWEPLFRHLVIVSPRILRLCVNCSVRMILPPTAGRHSLFQERKMSKQFLRQIHYWKQDSHRLDWKKRCWKLN